MDKINPIKQYYATFCANLVTFNYGANIGWLSPSLPILMSNETSLESGPISVEISSWIGSAVCIGGFLGAIASGILSDHIGHKKHLFLITIPQIISWLLITFAQNSWYLVASRFLAGIGGGSSIVVVPMFVTEISENNIRGFLGSILVVSINFGILAAYVLGNFMKYDVVSNIYLLLSIIFVISFWSVPDTPFYFVKQNNFEEAVKSLKYYKSVKTNDDEHIKKDIDNLKMSISLMSQEKPRISLKDFKSRSAIKSIIIGTVLMILTQSSGIFALVSYTSSIFAESGSSLSPNVSAIFIGITFTFGSYLSMILADRAGRKFLMITSFLGTSLGLICFGVFTNLKQSGLDLSRFSWIPLVCVSFGILAANWGMTSQPFVILSEISPPKLKSFNSTFCLGILWISAFVFVKWTPALIELLSLHGLMYFFATNAILGLIFVIMFMPETKGKSLEEINRILENK